MKAREIEILEHFLTRTSMWVHPVNKVSIVSFMHGFEAGIGDKTFTSRLKEYLESEFDIYGSSQGWPRQVLLYAEKKNIEWKDAFIAIGKKILQDIVKSSRE